MSWKFFMKAYFQRPKPGLSLEGSLGEIAPPPPPELTSYFEQNERFQYPKVLKYWDT